MTEEERNLLLVAAGSCELSAAHMRRRIEIDRKTGKRVTMYRCECCSGSAFGGSVMCPDCAEKTMKLLRRLAEED